MATKKAATKRTKASTPTEPEVVRRICRGPISSETRAAITGAIAKGKLDEARRLDAEGRRGCGYDLTDLILKHKADGQEFTVKCPTCGLESSHRAAAEGDE